MNKKPLTVGKLRKVLLDYPDEALVHVADEHHFYDPKIERTSTGISLEHKSCTLCGKEDPE